MEPRFAVHGGRANALCDGYEVWKITVAGECGPWEWNRGLRFMEEGPTRAANLDPIEALRRE
jgi:hypothetical protein